MIKAIREFVTFQILNKCPKCKGRLVRKGFDTIGVHYRKCVDCGWGE